MSSVVVNVLTCVVMVLVIFYIGYSEHVDNMNFWIVILVFSVVALLCVSTEGYAIGGSKLGSEYYEALGGSSGEALYQQHESPNDLMSLSSASSIGGDSSSVSSFSLSNLSM